MNLREIRKLKAQLGINPAVEVPQGVPVRVALGLMDIANEPEPTLEQYRKMSDAELDVWHVRLCGYNGTLLSEEVRRMSDDELSAEIEKIGRRLGIDVEQDEEPTRR